MRSSKARTLGAIIALGGMLFGPVAEAQRLPWRSPGFRPGFSFISSSLQTPIFVNGVQAQNVGAFASSLASPSITVASGNCLAVVVGYLDNSTGSIAQNVSDSLGNTFTLVLKQTVSNSFAMATYYATNVSGGSDVITLSNLGNGKTDPSIWVGQYSGVAKASPLLANPNNGSTLSNSLGPFSTQSAGSLVVVGIEASVTAAGSGYTLRQSGGSYQAVEDATFASVTSTTATFTVSSANGLMQALVLSPGS